VAAVHAARRAGLPLVYEVRALWEEGAVVVGTSRRGGVRYRAIRGLENYVLRRCDAVTTICEGLQGELISRGLPAEKVAVVPNGVDITRFVLDPPIDVKLARQLGLERTRVLGYVGSLNAYEGLACLVRALPAIVRRHPDVRLLIVGGGEQEEPLRRLASSMGVGEAVLMTGQVVHSDVPRYYALMNICVYPRLPSRALDLTTPLKPLEAMAQGKLVVASDVGGNRELIVDGETGVLFRAGDTESLADAIVEVLDNWTMTDTLRRAARKYVEAERGWPQLVARYEDVYTRVVRERASRRPTRVEW
jgi:PEP-CTERM/exosortase A-associated glycosyltransferase